MTIRYRKDHARFSDRLLLDRQAVSEHRIFRPTKPMGSKRLFVEPKVWEAPDKAYII